MKVTMTDEELKNLETILAKLAIVRPELTFLVAEISKERLHDLQFNDKDFFCDLQVQTQICLDAPNNDNLR